MPQLLPFDATATAAAAGSRDGMFPRSVCFSVPDAELPACPRRQAQQLARARELSNDWLRLQAQMRSLARRRDKENSSRGKENSVEHSRAKSGVGVGVVQLQSALQSVADMSQSVQAAQRMCVLQLHQMHAQTEALRRQARARPDEQEHFAPELQQHTSTQQLQQLQLQ